MNSEAPAGTTHLSWDGGETVQVAGSPEETLAAVSDALANGGVLTFQLPDGCTLLLNGARVSSVILGNNDAHPPLEKHIGM